MADAQHDLGPVTHFNTEAIGSPGQRRFRILLKAPAGAVVIWLEKEQLHSLAIAIERLLATIASDPSSGSSAAESPAPVAGAVSLDFQSGNWSIGYNETTRTLEFMAHDIEDGDTGPAKVRFLTTLEQSWSGTVRCRPAFFLLPMIHSLSMGPA